MNSRLVWSTEEDLVSEKKEKKRRGKEEGGWGERWMEGQRGKERRMSSWE